MMFQGLADRLTGIFDKLTKRGILTEAAVDETMREIKIALLEADVALPVVKEFIANVREKAVGEQIVKSVSPGQMVVKIVSDELVNLLGSAEELKILPHGQSVILMVGLQGSGKTTSTAKLAVRLKKSGKKVLMASLDVYRPAAQEQLAELAEKNSLDVLPIIKGQKPEDITRRALQEAKLSAYDVLILDTAGRLHIDEDMMREVGRIRDLSNPTETLLVVDAMMGQDAVNVAKEFSDKVGITGTVLTRIDGDSRGGAALSMRQVTGQPIKFLGVGEKTDALEVFDAKRIADRILGMGDILSLIEKASSGIDEQKAMKMVDKLRRNEMDFNDLLDQMDELKKMGPLSSVMNMIPGAAGKMSDEDAERSEKEMARSRAIIYCMTPAERAKPSLIDPKRKRRIAAGSGTKVEDVNRLLRQLEQSRKLMKMMSGKGGKKAKRMGFPGGFPGGMPGMM